MAAFLRKNEFEFLSYLAEKMNNSESFNEDSKQLQAILDRLDDQREKSNARTAKAVAERRIENPFYGRSDSECEKIEKNIVLRGADMIANNKIEYARNMCRIRGLRHKIKGEALFILNKNTKHFEQVCFSILNLSKDQINEMLDNYNEKIG